MANATDIQDLLRFLSQQAKIPLPTAMSHMKTLQVKGLTSASAISKSNVQAMQEVFGDEKVAKQVLNAAKRDTKKRAAGDEPKSPQAGKKRKAASGDNLTPVQIEESLSLPESTLGPEELSKIVLVTNRAPLVLAFAVMLLKHTMPEQPLSSRLSLAQAVVSVNSRSKAVNIGLESGKSAEEEGWGEGQPIVKIMGREIRVMKRWGYDWRESDTDQKPEGSAEADTQTTIQSEEPALWGLDLEALKKSNSSVPAQRKPTSASLPIYTAQSARAYLFRSSASAPTAESEASPGKKQTGASKDSEKEKNLGALLRALDLLYVSWVHVLDKDELNRRAWGWYVRVRPDVADGVAGWGGKNIVKLSDILDLRRM